MKCILISLMVLVVASSCDNGSKSKAQEQGGINSGGGNTLKARQASIKKIVDLIPVVHRIARFRLYDAEYMTWNLTNKDGVIIEGILDNSPTTPESQLPLVLESLENLILPFNSSPNIYDVVEKSKFHIYQDKPCRDVNGAPRDGSIAGLPQFEICLSPYQMSSKLDEDNMYKKLMGLMMKEYARHTGMADKPALQFQQFLGESEVTTLIDFRLAAEQFSSFVLEYVTAMDMLKIVVKQDPIDMEAFSKTMTLISSFEKSMLAPNSQYKFLDPQAYSDLANRIRQVSYLHQYKLGDYLKVFKPGETESTVAHMMKQILPKASISAASMKSRLVDEMLNSTLPIYRIELGNDKQIRAFLDKIEPELTAELDQLKDAAAEAEEITNQVIDLIVE